MKRLVLDTETTGLSPKDGHRIIEIGGVFITNGKPTQEFHCRINPERAIPADATAIHGITDAMVANEPTFADYAKDLAEKLKGKQLVIHNAAFDVGFLNAEFKRAGMGANWVYKNCKVFCTLAKARSKYPKKRNSLDALCERYGIDNSSRVKHDALTDAKLLAEVFFHLTGAKMRYSFFPSNNNTTIPPYQPASQGTGDIGSRIFWIAVAVIVLCAIGAGAS